MLVRIVLTIITFCLGSFPIEAKIIKTHHIAEVIPLIDETTWFLVDLDNCLFEGAQALGHAGWFYDEINQRKKKGMSKEDAIFDVYPQWIKLQKASRVKPLEENFVPALLALQEKYRNHGSNKSSTIHCRCNGTTSQFSRF